MLGGESSMGNSWHWASVNIFLLCVFSVLLRDLFILQVVRLVLTYNFSNCNFEEISNIYSEAIFPDLKEYLNGVSEKIFFKVYIFSWGKKG